MQQWARWRSDALMHLSRRFNRSWAKPDRVSLNLTLRCNLTCTMCNTCYDSPELSLDEIKTIIDQTSAWGVKVFNPLGGEPFMRSDIVEILDYAVKKGFYVTITTNGTLITPQRAALISRISSDRLHFNISLDGNAVVNDAIRGDGMYERAIEGLKRIRQADAQSGMSRRKILANTILHSQNMLNFEETLDEQALLGFDGVQILNLFRSDTDSTSESNPLWFKSGDLTELTRLCERLVKRVEKQNSTGFRIQNTIHEIRSIPRYYTEELKPLDLPCWSGWKELYINSDGQAIMCDGKLDFLKGAFGNVRQSSLQTLWRSQTLKQNRAVVKKCTTPCAQKCYLRPESDSGRALMRKALAMSGQTISKRFKRLSPFWKSHRHVALRFEISDVMPHKGNRLWEELISGCNVLPSATNWTHLRDTHQVDFGRGFMGFGVLKEILHDLHSSKIHFGELILGWRGDSIIHPEIEPILQFVYQKQLAGMFDTLKIETTGEFFRPQMLSNGKQDWLFHGNQFKTSDIQPLFDVGATLARVIIKISNENIDRLQDLMKSLPHCATVAGRFPPRSMGHVIWIPLEGKSLQQATNNHQLLKSIEQFQIPILNRPMPDPFIEPVELIVSWDGKLTLDNNDVLLSNPCADLNHESIRRAWNSHIE